MKKLFLLSFITVLAASLFMFGCSDDNEDVISPGSNDDPSYLTFISQFEGMDEVTGDNVEITFGFIEEIMMSMPVKTSRWSFPKKASGANDVLVTYHTASGYWYCTADDYDPMDSIMFNYVDSIQFKHGSTVVQWPNLDYLTEVKSYFTLTAEKNQVSMGSITQNLVITIAVPGSDILAVNGSGSIDVATEFTEIDMYDTTTCSVDFDYDVLFSNLVMDMNANNEESGLPCPESGMLSYTGAVVIGCTGANTGSVSGNWNVSESFDQGIISVVIISGNNSWSFTDSCDYTPPETIDSSMVVNILGGEDAFNNVFKSLDMSISLLDSIPQIPGKVAGSLKSLGGGEDIIITAINSYSYENGWHIFDFSADVIDNYNNDTVFVAGVDSVKLLLGGTPVQYPSGTESFDAINEHAHASYSQSWSDDFGAVHHLVEVALESSPTDTVITISGTTNDTASFSNEDQLMACSIDMNLNQTISSLVMSVVDNSGCPSSGSITTTAGLDMSCSGQNGSFNYNDDITVGLVVNQNGTITITYQSNNLNFSVTESCGEQLAAPSQSPWF